MSYITIHPSGLLDSTSANQMRCQVSDAINEGAEAILLDFQDVNFMNSSAIGSLVAILKSVKGQGKNLSICSINPQIKMIFELTKMEDIFPIYKDQRDFDDAMRDGMHEGKNLSYS